MLLISHRGNLNGPNPELENSPDYLEQAILAGFEVETDLWVDDAGVLQLGHDAPTYDITIDFLQKNKNKLWIHCKNLSALHYMLTLPGFRFFWHQNDDYTLTSNGYIWTYFEKPVGEKNILVIAGDIDRSELPNCYGVCSDYPQNLLK